MTVNRAAIYPLMRQGLSTIMGYYKDAPDKWKQMFKTVSTDQGYIYNVEFRGTGMAQRKLEGAETAQDSMGVSYESTSKPDTYGIKVAMTFESMEDNLYKSQFPRMMEELRSSLSAAKKQNAANVFNLGAFTNTMDGVPFFSEKHPLANGETNSNLGNIALSEESLRAGLLATRKFKKASGTLVQVDPQQLVTSAENEIVANVLLNSQFKASVGSLNDNNYAGVNDINSFYSNGYLPKGCIVDNYITSPTFAAMITDAADGLTHYSRQEVKTHTWEDDDTGSTWFKAWERYVFTVINWRAAYCLSL
jgi:hypothetical protein